MNQWMIYYDKLIAGGQIYLAVLLSEFATNVASSKQVLIISSTDLTSLRLTFQQFMIALLYNIMIHIMKLKFIWNSGVACGELQNQLYIS